MYKIFKYDVQIKDGIFFAEMPSDNILLRMDHVDDGFYKGDFCWAIVDPEDKTEQVFLPRHISWSRNPKPDNFDYLNKYQLSVKEKQVVSCAGKPVYAEDIDGKMYIYSQKDSIWGFEKEYDIVVYKTGQEITDPLDRLRYLGLNRLYIMQELALYTFLRKG